MTDKIDNATEKKPWRGLKPIDVGSVDEQTTSGVGNLGDQTGTDRWKPTIPPKDPKAILPDGE
jgi:hypothetical protein